jgi:hypothetical protein
MSYYAHLDSILRLESTNLQLYSLKKAACEWNEVIDLIINDGIGHVDHLKERLAFILSCLGLSLSQLLGQNCPSPEKEKMDNPGILLGKILKDNRVDRTKRRWLNNAFKDFLLYYDAVRHFGENKDQQNYRTIDQLTLKRLNRFVHMTVEIWDIIIVMYRKNPKNKIDDFNSISDDAIPFKDLPEGI